jgi:hypothetical protein
LTLIRFCSGLENKHNQTELKKEKERKIETEILYWFLSQTESTSSSLALPMLKHTSKRLQTTYKRKQSVCEIPGTLYTMLYPML